MTRLRQLMIEELRRRNFADSTIRSYIHGMEHFSQSIDVPISLALAALPMLFDWMVVGQVMPVNPAHAVRGPKHTQRRGRRECSPDSSDG